MLKNLIVFLIALKSTSLMAASKEKLLFDTSKCKYKSGAYSCKEIIPELLTAVIKNDRVITITTESRDQFLQNLQFEQMMGADQQQEITKIEYNAALTVTGQAKTNIDLRFQIAKGDKVLFNLQKESLNQRQLQWYIRKIAGLLASQKVSQAKKWSIRKPPAEFAASIELPKLSFQKIRLNFADIQLQPEQLESTKEDIEIIITMVNRILSKQEEINDLNFKTVIPQLQKDYNFLQNQKPNLSAEKIRELSSTFNNIKKNQDLLLVLYERYRINAIMEDYNQLMVAKKMNDLGDYQLNNKRVKSIKRSIQTYFFEVEDKPNQLQRKIRADKKQLEKIYFFLLSYEVTRQQREAEIAYLNYRFDNARQQLKTIDKLLARTPSFADGLDVRKLQQKNQEYRSRIDSTQVAFIQSQIMGQVSYLYTTYNKRKIQLYMKDNNEELAKEKARRESLKIYANAIKTVRKYKLREGSDVQIKIIEVLEYPLSEAPNGDLNDGIQEKICANISDQPSYCGNFVTNIIDYPKNTITGSEDQKKNAPGVIAFGVNSKAAPGGYFPDRGLNVYLAYISPTVNVFNYFGAGFQTFAGGSTTSTALASEINMDLTSIFFDFGWDGRRKAMATSSFAAYLSLLGRLSYHQVKYTVLATNTASSLNTASLGGYFGFGFTLGSPNGIFIEAGYGYEKVSPDITLGGAVVSAGILF